MDMSYCFTPNFELDSYGAFFQLSDDYFAQTGDGDFFGQFEWLDAVQQILTVARLQMESFYDAETAAFLKQAHVFNSQTQTFTGTLGINGLGNPVKYTGMIKAPFRPSDDSSIYQFLVPSNMMLSSFLAKTARIARLHNATLADEMLTMSKSIRTAIEKFAVVPHPDGSGRKIYAFEVDGYGGQNLMDDANLPSLLSAPLHDYSSAEDYPSSWQTYLNTREFVLSTANPWYSKGPLLSGIGSPHTSVGNAWPMGLMTAILTTDNDAEIIDQLRQLLTTTAGLGLMHESVDTHNDNFWTRQWFSWANSMFGQVILDLGERKPHILAMSFQETLFS